MSSEKEQKYEPKNWAEVNYNSIREMLVDVRAFIGEREPSFLDKGLREVLGVVEGLRYYSSDALFDLSNAFDAVKIYRRESDRGCRSCQYFKHFKTKRPNWFFYCGYDKSESRADARNRVNEFFKDGCDKWEPQLSPTLDEISD